MEEIIKLINMVGFPIVMCLLQFYLANKTIKDNTNVIKEIKNLISAFLSKK